jgi:hypothetical protein
LLGRIQSRIFFLATIGSFWTFVMASILPASIDVPRSGLARRYADYLPSGSGGLLSGGSMSVGWGDRLKDGFAALLWTAILGIGWECVYHFLMQWRWEKDWPTFFGLVTFLPEGILVYLLADNGVLPGFVGRGADYGIVPFWFFWPLFVVVWVAVWLWTNGPMRVFNVRWRFFGGRLV